MTDTVAPVPEQGRRPSLDSLTGLRFLAAAAVVVSHFSETGLAPVGHGVVGFLDGGRTAVSLFFVLSGFVLAYNYPALAGRVPRWNFAVARIARIYPVVLLGVVLGAVGMVHAWSRPTILLSWFALPSPDPAALWASFVAQLSMTTGWLPFASLNQPWNGPAWSISCEVFFYALFPVLIVWFRRWSPRTVLAVAVGAWVVQGLWILALLEWLPASRSGFLTVQFPLTHLTEFVLGIAAWRLWSSAPAIDRRVRVAALLATLAGLAVLALLAPTEPAYWPMAPLFAVLVALLASSGGRRRSWLALPVMLLLGEASYSLYLLHFPLIRIYQIAGVTPGIAGWIAMGMTVVLSVVVFRWYETPLRRAIRRRLRRDETAPVPAPDPR
ncbi:MAG: acyltransferase [Pseudonocardia sediminis]